MDFGKRNNSSIRDVSIIIPAHNEESVLRETVEDLQNYITNSAEVIIVEDGCTDKTPEISSKLAAEYTNTKHIHNEEKLGKGEAIRRAAEKAVNPVISFMDADKSSDLSFLGDGIELVERGEADIVIGSRHMENSKVERSWKRGFFSAVYNLMAGTLLGTGVKDHQCGLKVFRKEVYRDLIGDVDSKGFFWDTEILFRAKNKNYKVKEMPIKWKERPDPSFSILGIVPELLSGLYFLTGERIFGKRFTSINQYFKFAGIGAVGALINTVVLFILTSFLGIYYLLASPFAIETSIIVMFFLNDRITFKQKKEGILEKLEGIFRSNLVRIGGILINITLLFIFTEFLGIFYLFSNIIAIGIASIVNFFGEREFNWKKRLF